MLTDDEITYYVIPYNLYGGGEIYLENHIKQGTFRNLHLLFLQDNKLKHRLTGICPCTGFGGPGLLQKFLVSIKARSAAFHNSRRIYDLLRHVRQNTGLHISEVVHSNLKWSDSMHGADRSAVDAVYVVSRAVASEWGLIDYAVVPPVIDKKRFAVSPRLTEKITVGTVARFVPYKNLTRIVDIARHTDDEVQFVIVGQDGGTRQAVQDRITEADLTQKVFIRDFTAHIEQEYAGFDVFLLTSLVEGRPLVIEEALAAGLPVVTPISGGISEQMEGREGYLYDQDVSDEEIANQVMKWGRKHRTRKERAETSFAPENPPDADREAAPVIYLGPCHQAAPLPDYEPLVSVYIPTWNCADFLPRAIDSVLAQTYEKVEVCICDDGSTDDTLDILHTRYGHDQRVRWISQANAGVSQASNVAIGLCRGELLAQLDADDWLEPTAAAEVVQVFRDNPDLGLVYTSNRLVDDAGRVINRSDPRIGEFHPNLLMLEMIVSHWRVFKREVFELTAGFDPAVTTQDYDISLKLSEYGQCRYYPRMLYNYRQRADSVVRRRYRELVEDTEKVVNLALQRRCLPYRARRVFPETIQLQLFFDPDTFNSLTVSVVMVTRNNAATISRVMRSLQTQNHPLFEIIVVDNASTDETVKLVGRYENCRLLINQNRRATNADCLKTAIREAGGDYIALQDPALASAPDRIRYQLQCLTRIYKLCRFSGTLAPVPQGAVISRPPRSPARKDDARNIIDGSLMMPRRIATISPAGDLINGILQRFGDSSLMVISQPLM